MTLARPVVLWDYELHLQRHVAYCRLCDWHVADSSLTVVYRSGLAHAATHEGPQP